MHPKHTNPLSKLHEATLDQLEVGGFLWPSSFAQERIRAVITGASLDSDALKERLMPQFLNGFNYLVRLMEDNPRARFTADFVRDRRDFIYWFQNTLSMPDAAKLHCAWMFFSMYSDADSLMRAARDDPLLWVTGLQEWSTMRSTHHDQSGRGRGRGRGRGGRGGQAPGRGRGHVRFNNSSGGGAQKPAPSGRVPGFCDSVCVKGYKCGWRARNETCPYSHFCPLCTASKVEHAKWEDCPHHN